VQNRTAIRLPRNLAGEYQLGSDSGKFLLSES
jgi:hypothetical protein